MVPNTANSNSSGLEVKGVDELMALVPDNAKRCCKDFYKLGLSVLRRATIYYAQKTSVVLELNFLLLNHRG